MPEYVRVHMSICLKCIARISTDCSRLTEHYRCFIIFVMYIHSQNISQRVVYRHEEKYMEDKNNRETERGDESLFIHFRICAVNCVCSTTSMNLNCVVMYICSRQRKKKKTAVNPPVLYFILYLYLHLSIYLSIYKCIYII